MRRFWPFIFYFWFYAGIGFIGPFMVLYYQGLNFSGTEIGVLAGISPIVTFFFAPLWTGYADSKRRHLLVIALTLLGGIICLLVFPWLADFMIVLAILLIYSIFMSPVGSLADSATIATLEEEKSMFGRLRLGGTLGFAIAAPVAGFLVNQYGLKMAFWGCAVMFILALSSVPKFVHNSSKIQSSEVVSILQGGRMLVSNRQFVLILLGALGGGIAMAFANSYFFSYMKELGADTATSGLALTISTIAEVPVLFFGNQLIKKFNPFYIYVFGLFLTGFRLVLFGLAFTAQQALFIQLLGGLTFPLMLVSSVALIADYAPPGLNATAQGIFSAVYFGIGIGLGGFLGGILMDHIGAKGMASVFSVITLLVVVIIFLISKRVDLKIVEK